MQVGQELTVVGPGAPDDVQLFPGVTATVEASGLPANRELDLWLAPGFDYFYSIVLGGPLLDDSAFAGTVTTGPDGTLSAPFTEKSIR